MALSDERLPQAGQTAAATRFTFLELTTLHPSKVKAVSNHAHSKGCRHASRAGGIESIAIPSTVSLVMSRSGCVRRLPIAKFGQAALADTARSA